MLGHGTKESYMFPGTNAVTDIMEQKIIILISHILTNILYKYVILAEFGY